MLLVSPWLGRRRYAQLSRARCNDPQALTRYYKRFIARWGLLALVVPAALVLSPRVTPAQVGFALPSGLSADKVIILTAAASAGMVAGTVRARRRLQAGIALTGRQAYEAILPGTVHERHLALMVAIVAGVSEEMIFGGSSFRRASGQLACRRTWQRPLSLAIFACGHIYQGSTAVLGVTVLGSLMTTVYLSGSLLLPMLLHIVQDVRSLIITPANPVPETGRAAEDVAIDPETTRATGPA